MKDYSTSDIITKAFICLASAHYVFGSKFGPEDGIYVSGILVLGTLFFMCIKEKITDEK